MAIRTQTQRVLLLAFIASISLCAIVGIYCLLVGSWGPIQGRVLGTTAAVAAASILALALAVPWERRTWHPVGPLGCVAVAVALTLVLLAIWRSDHVDEPFFKTLGIATVFGLGLPLVGLLSLSRLRASFTWVRTATVGLLAVLAVQLIYAILVEPSGDLILRLIGVVSIASACGTIAVPILHRLSSIPADGDAAGYRLSVICPRCGHPQELTTGRSACPECRLGFRVEIEG